MLFGHTFLFCLVFAVGGEDRERERERRGRVARERGAARDGERFIGCACV